MPGDAPRPVDPHRETGSGIVLSFAECNSRIDESLSRPFYLFFAKAESPDSSLLQANGSYAEIFLIG